MNKRLRSRRMLSFAASVLVFGLVSVLGFVLIAVVTPVCTLAAGSSDELPENDFRGSATLINEGNKQYKGVRMTAEIYRATQPNLADLRVFASDGKPVPYLIHHFSSQTTAINQSYPMTLLDSFKKGEYFYYDYVVNAAENEDILATSIAVATENSDFAKQVEIWGSYDNQHWEKIKDEILYRVEGKEQLEIALGKAAKKYTHYRFKIANNLELLSFTSVALNYNDITLTKERFTDTCSLPFTVEEQKGKTLIKLSGLRNLKLESITLATDSIFKRRVSFAGVSAKMLYNLSFQKTIYRDLTLPLDGFVARTDSAVMVIENNDDQPIKIDHVMVRYYVDEVIFNGAESGDYVLKFGDRQLTVPPKYDLVNYRDQILQEGYNLLPLLDLKVLPAGQQPADEQPSSFNPQLLFNIVIIAVALLLGGIILWKLKKIY